MTQEAQPQAVFNSNLLDASGQPNLIKNSSQCQELIWTLVNNQNLELVVTPFESGKVDQNQYHFVFEFSPGALTSTPTLEGWDVYALKDNDGRINSLYVALSGNQPLRIGAGGNNKATLTYSDANPKDTRKRYGTRPQANFAMSRPSSAGSGG